LAVGCTKSFPIGCDIAPSIKSSGPGKPDPIERCLPVLTACNAFYGTMLGCFDVRCECWYELKASRWIELGIWLRTDELKSMLSSSSMMPIYRSVCVTGNSTLWSGSRFAVCMFNISDASMIPEFPSV
jgi:hypothetical protein